MSAQEIAKRQDERISPPGVRAKWLLVIALVVAGVVLIRTPERATAPRACASMYEVESCEPEARSGHEVCSWQPVIAPYTCDETGHCVMAMLPKNRIYRVREVSCAGVQSEWAYLGEEQR